MVAARELAGQVVQRVVGIVKVEVDKDAHAHPDWGVSVKGHEPTAGERLTEGEDVRYL